MLPQLLTEQMLHDMEDDTIFAKGTHTDKRLMPGTIKWIAKRGSGRGDWAIYYHQSTHSDAYVRNLGNKVITESIITHLVPCDKDALALYRK